MGGINTSRLDFEAGEASWCEHGVSLYFSRFSV